MNNKRLIAFASLALAALAWLPGTSAGQTGQVKSKSLKPEEFKQIHGTTDRYELLGMEVKGDCTQCHERRSETEIRTGLGFDLLSKDGGGETLRPFELLDSHLVGELDVYHRNPAWGQFNFIGQYLGDVYHSVDADARYKNLAVGAFSSRGYPHNMEHLLLPPPTAETPVPIYNPDDQDAGDDYTKKLSEQIAHLRVGPGTYPAHLTLDARRFSKKGDMQQTYLDENCTTNCHNISQTRDLDLTTSELRGGADSHLGWAAVSYAYDYLELRDGEDDPTHLYGSIPGVWGGGVVAHNTTPDMKAWEHKVAVNSMMTGGLAAWADFSVGKRRNEDADIDEDYYRGAADATWRPFGWASVAAQYRRFHRKDDVSSSVEAFRTSAGLPGELEITEDRYTGIVAVQPHRTLSMRANFVYKDEQREEAGGFGEPENTRTNEWGVTASYRPARRISFRAAYEGLRTEDDPVYVNSPSNSTIVRAGATAQPWAYLLLNADWQNVDSENRFTDFENDRNSIQVGATVFPAAAITFGAYYSHFHAEASRTEGSIPSGGFLLVDDGISYDTDGDQFVANASWQPVQRFSAKIEYSWLKAKGTMDSSSSTYEDLGNYSDFEATQQDVSLDLQYDLQNGWGLGGRGGWSKYEETEGGSDDEKVWDGRVTVTKRW